MLTTCNKILNNSLKKAGRRRCSKVIAQPNYVEKLSAYHYFFISIKNWDVLLKEKTWIVDNADLKKWTQIALRQEVLWGNLFMYLQHRVVFPTHAFLTGKIYCAQLYQSWHGREKKNNISFAFDIRIRRRIRRYFLLDSITLEIFI